MIHNTTSRPVVRCMIPQDIEAVVHLHVQAFPKFFLTSMGKPFLRLLYMGFITQPNGLFLVAENAGTVIGFAVGTADPSGFFRRLLRRQGFRFACAATSGLLRYPLLATRKCLGALFYRGETPNGIPDAALLSSLAVSPSTQSKGIGQALVRAFADEARKCGCQSVYLTTDEANNEKANRFYAKCGFQLLDTFNRSGNRVMNRWTMRLT